jgi:hypothetical protein
LPPPTPPSKRSSILSPKLTLNSPSPFNIPASPISFHYPSESSPSHSGLSVAKTEAAKIISLEEQKKNKALLENPIDIKFGTKLSQKQRKKLALEQNAVTEASRASSSASSAWKTPTKKPVVDLNSVFSEQTNHIDLGSKVNFNQPLKWKHEIVQKPSASFLSIQLEQAKDKAMITKERSKSLHVIQKEESAIEALSVYYESTSGAGTGEWITIKRKAI